MYFVAYRNVAYRKVCHLLLFYIIHSTAILLLLNMATYLNVHTLKAIIIISLCSE